MLGRIMWRNGLVDAAIVSFAPLLASYSCLELPASSRSSR